MAVNFRMGRRGAPLTRLNSQPRQQVKVWKPLGEAIPPITPITLTFSTGNTLTLAGIANAPEWFTNADFVLMTGSGGKAFTWNGTAWETLDEFASETGSGYVVQDGNSIPAQWFNAELPLGNVIEQADAIYWMGASGTPILWSGI